MSVVTERPDAEEIEELYHRARGRAKLGELSGDSVMSEVMSAARTHPEEDQVWVVFTVAVGDVIETDYYTADEFPPSTMTGDFALRVSPSHYCSYADLWEQVEPQFNSIIEQFANNR